MQNRNKRTFLHDAIDIISVGTKSIETDDFNRCFESNTTNIIDQSIFMYLCSIFTRYFILLPFRLSMLIGSLLIYILLISIALYHNSENERAFSYNFILKALNYILGAKVINHGKKLRLDRPHLFVSNHTSFVDFLILSNYSFPNACVSENHGGLFTMLFRLILGKNGSISFKRSEKMDRVLVKELLQKYINLKKLPMLVFPEGTCVNNKYVVMFQKGVFELGAEICPVAIKYNKDVMDPYWNRRKQGFVIYILYLLTRWGIEADVYWLPPVKKQQEESVSEFSERTRRLIAETCNLKVSLWNGYLKSSPAINDRSLLKIAFIEIYSKIRKNELSKTEACLDYSTSHTGFLFQKIAYKEMLLLILQEYHRLKSISSKDQDNLIKAHIGRLNFKLPEKSKCSCKFIKSRKFKKLRNCKSS